MKIYFAGSIRGGRDDKEVYFQLIEHLHRYGEVLTEHVGDKKLTSYWENNRSDSQIYDRDVSWIEESDICIAEVSTPSLGVGYEIAHAEHLGKKILCLYRNQEGKRVSAMINWSQKINVVTYNTIQEAIKHIDEFFLAI
jgi:2'-deoxynucleoside 5'-phosphate N-hydrolase